MFKFCIVLCILLISINDVISSVLFPTKALSGGNNDSRQSNTSYGAVNLTSIKHLNGNYENGGNIRESSLPIMSENAMVLLGGSKHGKSISTFALTSRSVCPNGFIPSLPSGSSASFAAYADNSIIVCGGRENTLKLNNECWKYNLTVHHHNYENDETDEGGLWKEWKESQMWKEEQKSWERIASLPSPLAGSAVASFQGNIWVFGGLVEEDYYDTEIQNEYYYYDYSVEVAGNGVIVYDPTKNDWHSVDTILPKARFGSCALVHNDKIILIGGKGHMEDVNGSDELLEFDPNKKEWTTNDDKTWPKMKRQRYYHGCTLGTLDGEKGIYVAGGIGDKSNNGNSAEFLSFESSKGQPKWVELPPLQKPHPNMPGVSFMEGSVFVIGGGGPPFSGGEKMIEVFDGVKWSSFVALNQEKIFASNVVIPNYWFSSCEMEPNLGIHKYHQKKTAQMLEGKQWICNGEHLQMSDQEDSLIVGGCTIPGCYYPHFFSHHVNSSVTKTMRVRGGRLLCQHADHGTPANRIECQLKCKNGWKNANDIDVTICTKGQVEALSRIKNLTDDTFHNPHGSLRKTTNFTTDYLECRRDLGLQSSPNLQASVSPLPNRINTSMTPMNTEISTTFVLNNETTESMESVGVEPN